MIFRWLQVCELGRAALFVFEVGNALVEGKRLLDLLKALDNGFEANSVDLFDGVKGACPGSLAVREFRAVQGPENPVRLVVRPLQRP
jgi:hypothetical protein